MASCPDQSLFYNTRGVLKANRLVDWDGALRDLDKAVQLDPTNGNAYHTPGDDRKAVTNAA